VTDERRGFIDAIRESPDDIALHLVFADWLDENQEGPLATSVRRHILVDPKARCQRTGLGCRIDSRCGCEACGPLQLWKATFQSPEFFPYRWTGFGTAGAEWFRNGAIQSVACQPKAWLDRGRQFVERWPVTKVFFNDIWHERQIDRFRPVLEQMGFSITTGRFDESAFTRHDRYLSWLALNWALGEPTMSFEEWRDKVAFPEYAREATT
jgi:uncharacterized protein (TIGR02996 family)